MTSPGDFLDLLRMEESWDEPVTPTRPVCLGCANPMEGTGIFCVFCEMELMQNKCWPQKEDIVEPYPGSGEPRC